MSRIFFLVVLFLSPFLFAQADSIQLIRPTGNYPVGTIAYEWMDESRDLQIASHQGDKRSIVVQFWYPAKIDSISLKAPYSALSKDYQNVLGNSYSRPSFSSEIIKSNLILVAPGRGTERFLYSSICEELASHGYIVASVDMPEIGYVIYQDGLEVRPSEKFKPPGGMMGGPYEKVDQFFEAPTELGYRDLQLAYDNIVILNNEDPNNRFNGKINTESIGIFGHSLGGRIAGKFAVENPNVKAYISMEGIPPRDIRYNGKMKIPIALLCSSGTWPYAKENYFSIINNRSHPIHMIELETFGHNSVTDNPYIFPDSFAYEIDPETGLKISRKIMLTYFNSIFVNDRSFNLSIKNIKQVKLTRFD